MDMIGISWSVPPGAHEVAVGSYAAESDAMPTLRAFQEWERGLPKPTVARVRAYMAAHIGDSISLENLAKVACMSRFHFARRFRQSTGLSPMAYLLALRIDRAQRLLAQGESKIADIAAELGFFDQSHFARTFRRNTGMSPRAYALHCEALSCAE